MQIRVAAVLGLIVLAAASIVPAGAAAAPAEQAAGCRFVMGFAQLRQLIGAEKVGDCLENERAAANGDAVQRTSGGLLVWRKADNFTAFTDGYRSWVNGPNGLQSRLNTEKFDWEAGPAPAAAAQPPAVAIERNTCPHESAVLTVDRRAAAGDAAELSGTVTNGCNEPVDVEIDVVARSRRDDPNSPPLVDAPSVGVMGIPAGGAKPFTVRVPGAANAPSFSLDAFPIPTRFDRAVCVEVGASKCLVVDRRLWSAVVALLPFTETRQLLQGAAEDGVAVLDAKLPAGARGIYVTRLKALAIDEGLDASSSWARADVMAHELRHAADQRAGLLTNDEQSCYRAEEAAFRTSSAYWQWLWGTQAPPEYDDIHKTIAGVARAAAENTAALRNAITRTYQHACTPRQ